MILCDFHVHSTFSDGRLTVKELVDLYGRLGFGAIAITDHLCEEQSWLGISARFLGRTLTRKTFPRYIETLRVEADRAWAEYRMLLIPGFELTKNSVVNRRSAHVLALGVEEFLSADREIEHLLGEIRARNGLSIAAHPVNTGVFEPQTYFLWSRREELRHHFDAWEVASGAELFPEVLHSGLNLLANSDLHHPRQMRSWKTQLYLERTRDWNKIFHAIRQQNLNFVFFDPDSTVLGSSPQRRSPAGERAPIFIPNQHFA